MFGKKKSTKVEVAIEVASSALQIQFDLAGSTLDRVAAAHDQYALGYVFGFHDGVCQLLDVLSNTTQGFGVLAASYARLASSPGVGGTIVRQCFDLQKNGVFMQGVFAGGKEALDYCQNNTPPMGLAGHLQS